MSVEIARGAAYCAAAREPGAGGLPTGTSGRALCLLSGGIDSPVAAWRVMRRGCRVDVVHFHSHPITSARSQQVVGDQVRVLARHQGSVQLAITPLADVQKHVAVAVAAGLRTVLHRRFMARIAVELARRHDARALVTGDALGQVASQTLDNLALADQVSSLPVLRPLIGSDKDEILALGNRLGTAQHVLDASDDCCAVFAPRHAATRPLARQVAAAEQTMDVDALVGAAVGATTWVAIAPDWS